MLEARLQTSYQGAQNETAPYSREADNATPIPATAFYILIIILIALSSFFMSMIVANAEILHSRLIWKAVICCILIAVLGIGIAIIVQKFLGRE